MSKQQIESTIILDEIGKREISIFHTSVRKKSDVLFLSNLLDIIVGKGYWNFDLEDRDNILRIDSNASINNFLSKEINNMGFDCAEIF